MNIKWRLTVLGVQLVLLMIATFLVTGNPFVNKTWFFAGLLAIAINPQLLEPRYPRPGDVIGNSILFLFLYASSPKQTTALGWHFLSISMFLALILAIFSLLIGSKHQNKMHESRKKRRESAIWQRRYWEHQIRNEEDLSIHFDYVQYNPVKHGLVNRVKDWPWSRIEMCAIGAPYISLG